MSYTRSAELYDLIYGWKDYVAESARLRELVAARNPGAKTLLDVACGTGRHLEHLRRWYEVEGLDAGAGLLDIARGRLPGVPLHEGDMRDFDLQRTFDAVTCLFGSIAYLPTTADLSAAVANMARHLAPGGVLIVEPFLTPDRFDRRHLARAIEGEGADLRVVRMNGHRFEGDRAVLEMHFLVARPGTVEHFHEDHTVSLFTDDQCRAAFEGAGLIVEHDQEGLIGRGLWIGARSERPAVGNL